MTFVNLLWFWIIIRLRNILIVPQRNWAIKINCYDDFSAEHWKSNCENAEAPAGVTKSLGQRISRSERLYFNSSPPEQNGHHLADDNFKCIFLNENDKIPIRISLKCVPRSQIDNALVLVQVMAWRRTGDKSLPELMLTQFTDAYMRH